MSRVINWYPLLTPQQDPVECGFVCVSAIAAMYGFPTSVAGLRQLFGGTSRGLKLHELQHVLQVAGARTQAFAFDVSRLGAYPSPGIVLLKRAHYVVIGRISQKYVSVFDPATGAWRNLRPERLARESTGFGILVTGFKPAVSNERPAHDGLARRVLRASVSRFGLRVACLAVLAQLIGMSLPLATGLFVNAITKSQTNGVALLAIGYLAVSAVGSVTWIISRAAREYLTARVQTMTSGWLLDRLACMDQGSFDRCSRATLHGQIGALSELQSFYSTVIAKIGDAAVLTIVGAIALIFVSPWLAVPGFIALGISVTLDVAFRKRLQESQTDLQHVSRESMHFTLDILSQFPVFQRLDAQIGARSRFRAHIRRLAHARRAAASLRERRSAFGAILSNIENIAFMSTAGFFMFRDNLTLGTFVVAALYKDQLKNSVGLAFDTWKRHQLLLPQRQLLAELPLPSSSASQSREITDGGIDFRDVSFRYFAFEPEVLKNFSIQIEPGEVVAFAGPSGVGKTTVARLIIGTLSPSSGSVLVDQLPAQAGTPGVGCLLQTDRLISGTVRDNVLMFRRGISDLDIWAALRTVCLDGLVEQLPMGLMTPVAEGLGGLSAGQRQRILLARTIVTKPRVLVLDEATSHLDASLEARIMEQLRCTNATIVLISHRSDLWRMADRVVEMSGSEAPILRRNMKDSGRTAETVEAA